MTYDARERSTQDGQPVEVYTFARGLTVWRFTSADRAVSIAGQTFEPRTLSRTRIEQAQERARSSITVTCPRTFEVAELFRISPPTETVTLVLQQYHAGDAEAATIWSGRIMAVSFSGSGAEILLEPIFTSIRRLGLRRIYQRQCPHALYGGPCGVNRETLRIDGTIATISGTVITVAAAAAQADGWFAGGYAQMGIDRRFITAHAGSSLTLQLPPYGIAAGAAVSLFPGCAHTLDDCNTKFSNAPNYGGFPFFPAKNPFGAAPIF